MKKFLSFLLILFFFGFAAIYFYFLKLDVKKKIESNYYLLFHSNLSIEKFEKDKIFPWIISIYGISDKLFYIENVKCNLLTKKVKVSNLEIYFDKFTFENILKDFKYLNIPIREVEIIGANINDTKFSINKLFGKIHFTDNSIVFSSFCFLNNSLTKFYFNIANFSNLNLNIDFNKIKLNSFLSLVNIPFLVDNEIYVKGELKFYGNINKNLINKFQVVYDNNTISGFIKKSDYSTNIYNSFILLPNNNKVVFSAQIFSPQNYKIILQSDNDISGEYNNFSFKNIKIDYIFEKNSNLKNGNINISGEFLKIPDSTIFFNSVKSININAKLQKLQINNDIFLENVDLSTANLNSKISFNKINFDMDDGSFIFSYIPEIDSNPVQIAADIKNINIKKFLNIFNYKPSFNGNFNCSFIAEGKNKELLNGKGYFFIENFIINGINLDNITKEISENNIVNFSFYNYDNVSVASDNLTNNTKFDVVKGFVKPDKNFLKFYKVSMLSKKGFLLLDGNLDLNNLNNLILSGILKSNKKVENIILNLNFDRKIAQILKK